MGRITGRYDAFDAALRHALVNPAPRAGEEMTSKREVLPPPPPVPSQSGIVDRVPGPVVVLLWVGLVVGGHLWAGLKGLVFTGPIALIVLPVTRWRPLVERVPGPVVVLLWVGLLAGAYLWTGLKGLVFTGAIALMVAVMLYRRPKEPPKTWVGIFWSCWGLFMYSSNGAEWYLTMPPAFGLVALTAWRYWLSRAAAAE